MKVAKGISNAFWKETVLAWAKYVKIYARDGIEDIVSCSLVGLHTIVNNNVLKVCKKIRDKGCVNVNGLLSERNVFYTHQEFCDKYNVRINYFDYACLVNSIPKEWKDIIKQHDAKIENPTREYVEQMITRDKVCSYVYWNFIEQEKCSIKQQNKWNETCQKQDWKVCYSMSYKVTVDTKLRELQYKILNRFVPTNRWLYKRKLIDTEQCSFCNNHTEDIEHLFWYCEKVQIIWKDLCNWLHPYLVIRDLKKEQVLFGLKNNNSGNILFNFIALIVKKFFLNCKWKNVVPNIRSLQRLIEIYYRTELYIALGDEKKLKRFKWKWNTCDALFEK